MLGKGLPHTASDKPKFQVRLNKRQSPYYQDLLLLFVHAIKRIKFGVNTRRHLMVKTKPVENSFRKEDLIAQAFSAIFGPVNDPGMNAEEKQLIEAVCQRMMDAYWFENAENPDKRSLSDTSLCILSGKGLHLLERASLQDEELLMKLEPIFTSQYLPAKLLHLNRWADNDEIENSLANIFAAFRRTAGPSPNIRTTDSPRSHTYTWYLSCSPGLPVSEAEQQYTVGTGNETRQRRMYTFSARDLTEWICEFTNVMGRDEAAEMSAQFVRCGLISLVSDKRGAGEKAIIWTVKGVGGLGSGYPFVQETGEFRATAKAIYRITEEGERLVNWSPKPDMNRNDDKDEETWLLYSEEETATSLRDILGNQGLCELFYGFLDKRFLGDHLRFYLDLDQLAEFGMAFKMLVPERGFLDESSPQSDLVMNVEICWRDFFDALQGIQRRWLVSISDLVSESLITRESFSKIKECSSSIPVNIMQKSENSLEISDHNHKLVQELLDVVAGVCSYMRPVVYAQMSESLQQFKRTPQYIALKSKLGRGRSHLGGDVKKVTQRETFITVSQRGLEQERRFRGEEARFN